MSAPVNPHTSWQARIDDASTPRRLLLDGDGATLFDMPLDCGGRHRLITPDAATTDNLVEALEQLSGMMVLPAGGGLLGAATVAENIDLALRFTDNRRDESSSDWDDAIRIALHLAGMDAERIASIGRERPMNLSRIERWTLGFACQLLRTAEVLILDRVFIGLSRREVTVVTELVGLYHDYHPFQPILLVDIDSHELPRIPDCVTLVDLAPEPMPC